MEPLQMNEKMVPKLPENWVWTTLGGCVDILDRKRVPINAKERDERKGNIPYYGATGQVGWIDDYLFDEELVLLGEDGAPFFDSTKNTAYIIRGKSWVNNHAHVLRAIFGVTLNQFLCNYLNNFNYQSYVTGTTRHKLNQSQMRIIPLPLPPLSEQRRIVTKIEELFARLDAGVGALTKAKAQLKRYHQSVLKSACEGRLVPTEAELARDDGRDYEPADMLLERIQKERRKKWGAEKKRKGKKSAKYKEPAALDVGGLPELPEGWCWATVEQLNPASRPCAYGVLQPGNDVKDGVFLVRVGDISNGRISVQDMKRIKPEIAEQYPRTRLQGGEVLITLVGAIGRTAVVPASLSGANTARAVGVISLNGNVKAEWVEIWFRNPQKIREITSKAHEVARKTLNLEDVRVATVALPPITEQHRIVVEIERRLSVVDEIEKTVDQSLKQADRLRQSILKRAFEGKLVPQDSNDEPASVLLKRIKEEKVRRDAEEKAKNKRKRKGNPKQK